MACIRVYGIHDSPRIDEILKSSVDGITATAARTRKLLERSTAMAAALTP